MSTESSEEKPKYNFTLQPIGGGAAQPPQTPAETATTNITPPAATNPVPPYTPSAPRQPSTVYQPGTAYQPGATYQPNIASQESSAYRPAMAPSVTEVEDDPHPARIFIGIAAGMAIGLVCAWLYAKFQLMTGMGHSLITGGIGWIVGFAVLVGAGRGGMLAALCGGAVSFIVLFFSRFWLLSDYLGQEFKGTTLPFNGETIQLTLQSFTHNPLSIIVLLVGVAGGFLVPFRAATSEVDDD